MNHIYLVSDCKIPLVPPSRKGEVWRPPLKKGGRGGFDCLSNNMNKCHLGKVLSYVNNIESRGEG